MFSQGTEETSLDANQANKVYNVVNTMSISHRVSKQMKDFHACAHAWQRNVGRAILDSSAKIARKAQQNPLKDPSVQPIIDGFLVPAL